jgi:Pyruvate/2-oxoacid:ferredoxin oxidoreductase delta subunit
MQGHQKGRTMKKKPLFGLRLPSTRAFMREANHIEGFSLFDRLHGFVYIHWPYFYIGAGLGEHPLSKFLGPLGRLITSKKDLTEDKAKIAPGYHGKVVPLEAAKQLVTVQEDIRLENLEQIIPHAHARDIVLKNPDHIVALECPCRVARPEPCLPLDVCLIVGEPFASFIIEHHPNRSRWIDAGEAVAILEDEQERGHVSHAFFKNAMLERFYAICNCCTCCCGAMQITRSGDPMLISSGYIAVVDGEKCQKCETCQQFCQFNAIDFLDDYAQIDDIACMGCGVCVAHCPEEAIVLERDPTKSQPLIIQELISEMDTMDI